ncbi:lipase family protein, partial [Micrococcus luteus]|uniref:lipase family protein n=1 Tax=Micrococcus luteus TaxID=1270 RepID=UPI00190F515F
MTTTAWPRLSRDVIPTPSYCTPVERVREGAQRSAAELAPDYAPELDLKGAYAGAPPAD